MASHAVVRLSLAVLLTLVLIPSSALAAGLLDPAQTPGQGATRTGEAPESPEASAVGASGTLTYASRYLFQGIDYSNAKPVLNPQADVNMGAVQARLWVNHDLDLHVTNEFDLSLFHEWSAKKFSFTTGYTYLWYPHREGWTPSQELYLEASREAPLNPTLSIHYDFDAGMGSYSTFGLSHSVERPMGTFSVGANLFYQDHYYGITGIPSTEWNVHFEKPFKKTTVTPSVSRFVTWANGDFRDVNAVKSAWVFSLGIAREF